MVSVDAYWTFPFPTTRNIASKEFVLSELLNHIRQSLALRRGLFNLVSDKEPQYLTNNLYINSCNVRRFVCPQNIYLSSLIFTINIFGDLSKFNLNPNQNHDKNMYSKQQLYNGSLCANIVYCMNNFKYLQRYSHIQYLPNSMKAHCRKPLYVDLLVLLASLPLECNICLFFMRFWVFRLFL